MRPPARPKAALGTLGPPAKVGGGAGRPAGGAARGRRAALGLGGQASRQEGAGPEAGAGPRAGAGACSPQGPPEVGQSRAPAWRGGRGRGARWEA